ncbi:MAG: (2Fe-2S)-binding protein [bacterium]|nr:(2Fe-2S)-binding protein [bacterium]
MTFELHTIRLTVNGAAVSVQVESRQTLAGALRDQLGLTGTNLGCEHGVCGACTVLLDGRTARSCTLLAVQAQGRSVTTVEGLAAEGERLHPVQQAFAEHHALQCGFCTPGFLLTTIEYLDEAPANDSEAIRQRLSGNLCRCTGYHNIVAAVKDLVRRQAAP